MRLQIWDTAGQERFRTITKAYYKGADGVLVVFDLTDRDSFLNIDGWLKEVEKHCGTDVNVIVLANKADVAERPADGEEEEDDEQEREIEVTDRDILEFEQTHNLKVLKTSAKTGQGVDDAFLEMTKSLIKRKNSMSAEERKR